MLIGVAWTVDSRFSAVTTISSKPVFSAPGFAPGDAASAEWDRAAQTSTAARIEAATREALPFA
jgi:hypothetical protein